MKIKRLPVLLLIILVLNLIWEFSHYRLYLDLTGIPATPHLILASFVDVFLVMTVVLFISLKSRSVGWINQCGEKNHFFFVVFSLILAFIWETINLSLGRWIYSVDMPLFFGVGLSPLLQLAITGSIALCIFGRINKKLNKKKSKKKK